VTVISALVSCNAVNPTQAQADALRKRAEWYVINRRNSRVFFDLIGDKVDLQWILDQLTNAGLDPILIMAWRQDTGQQVKSIALNTAEFLNVAPDVWDLTLQPPQQVRPTAYVQTHEWAGAARQLPGVIEP
jgi:hypothetical protein